eukprot:TRINITY_DN16972_c0_g1_i1.p1 TRINITY_DN16972_c0_g1~~TRINITY_DN16972_c0_g1_i1.p1  ORF type:complete len:280 (+),score=22.14 TRINITY_DN16972_c0_g1_i1:190-1029(+)
MALRRRNQKSYRPCGYEPYACAAVIRRLVREEVLNVPLFSDVDYEILHETDNEPSPSWLITESKDRYAFVVARTDLSFEDVEIQVERLNADTPVFCYSSNAGTRSSRTLLTILCSRKSGGRLSDSPWMDGDSGRRTEWKFGRRFKLPSDAQPEAATAAREDGSVTVVIPRRNSSSSSSSSSWLDSASSDRGGNVRLGQAWSGNLGDRVTEVLEGSSASRTAFAFDFGLNKSGVTAQSGGSRPSVLDIKWVNVTPLSGPCCSANQTGYAGSCHGDMMECM